LFDHGSGRVGHAAAERPVPEGRCVTKLLSINRYSSTLPETSTRV
jgi:hypothetical protein